MMLEKTNGMFSTDNAGQKQGAWDNYNEPAEQEFSPYHPKLYALTDQVDEKKIIIPDLRKILGVPSADIDGCQAVTLVGKQSLTINYDTDDAFQLSALAEGAL